MRKYARIVNDKVTDVVVKEKDIERYFHPSVAAQFVEVSINDEVFFGQLYDPDTETFSDPPDLGPTFTDVELLAKALEDKGTIQRSDLPDKIKNSLNEKDQSVPK